MKVNRAIPPKEKSVKRFKLPFIESFYLDNGLQIYFSQKQKLPIVKLNLMIPAGSRFDEYGREGLAYLTSLLIDEGAGNYNALQLAKEIDMLGSSIDISTSVDFIFLSLTSLTENFERTLELLSLILKEPLLNEQDFQREKKKHVTKIIQSFDEAAYIGSTAFQRNIFRGSQYDKPILGFPQSVETINLTILKDFHSRYFHTPLTKMVAVGAIDKIELNELLSKYLGDYSLDKIITINDNQLNRNSAALYFIDKEDAVQSEIIAGHLIKERTAPDYLAAKVANTIFGGQFSSRINLNLREDKGYTYGAHSALSYNKQFGYLNISTSIQSEFTLNSIIEIREEINKMHNTITDKEISFAKSSLIKQFPSMFETYSQLVQRITTNVTYDINDFYDNYIQNIWELTPEEIHTAAREYFKPEELCLFVVGNKELVFNDLKNIDDLELIELDKFGNPI